MANQSAFARLLGELRAPAHDFRPTTDVFPALDRDQIAKDLELERLGTERGARNEPATNSTTLDDVETRIVERIEFEKKRAHGVAEDELHTYAERLGNLHFEQSFFTIKEAARACISDFRANVSQGVDVLHDKRKRLLDHESELEYFKRKNKINRAPRIHSGAFDLLKISILVFLLLIETGFNSTFLAKGSELGLIGGVTEAFGFSFLNIFFAFIIALYGARNLFHRNPLRRLIGILALPLYAAVAASISLSLAHYREVSSAFSEAAGRAVLERMSSHPFALEEINSWVLFGISLACSLVAFIEGCLWTDPYPGYGDIERRLRVARADYVENRESLIHDLSEIRDQYRDEIKEVSTAMSVKRGEYDSILSARSRLLQLFQEHQAQLERSGNALLITYREANTRARTAAAPKRFGKGMVLEKVALAVQESAEDRAEIMRLVTDARTLLGGQLEELHAEYEQAIGKYHQLDQLLPENARVATQ